MYAQHTWVLSEVISAAKLNNIEQGIADLWDLHVPPLGTVMTPTRTGRKLTQLVSNNAKFVINWATTGMKVSTIQYYNPTATLVATFTPTYTGRYITAWTRS